MKIAKFDCSKKRGEKCLAFILLSLEHLILIKILSKINVKFGGEKLDQENVLNTSKILSDEYALKILAGTFKEPKSAQEISIKFNIPIAVCYRKIHDLEDTGFLECVDKILTQEGRRVKLYRSQLKGAYIFFEHGKLRVHLSLTKVPQVDFDGTWDALGLIQPAETPIF